MKSWLFLLWLLAVPIPVRAADLAGARPNIIVVMPDDMGWGDIAAHGHPLVQTPHLDRMFRESLRFTDFHVSPTCAPTRSAIMSGRHEFRNGVTHTIYERERMALDTITLPAELKKAGYTTGIFGKWHLGDEAEYRPDQRGFDEVYIHGAGGIGQTYAGSCGDFPGNQYHDPALLHNGTIKKEQGYCTDLFFAQALKWMDAQRTAGRPFFTFITPNAPHGPLISPGAKYDAPYLGKEIAGQKLNEGDVAYYAMISNIDENMGRLFQALKDWKVERETLVLFLCDNGGTHTRLHSGGFRGGKGQVYHGGTHSPAFWRWTGRLKQGVDCPVMAAHIDLFPTLLALAGEAPSAVLEKQWEGRSLLPLLENPYSPWPDRILFTHLGRWPAGQAPLSQHENASVRNARFRLVNNRELYDLKADPGETTNVIGAHSEEVVRLREAYDAWWRETLPLMVNENARGPKINPLKELYWRQFGGGPDEALLKQMDPEGKFAPPPASKKATPKAAVPAPKA